MSGYCTECGNTLCICDESRKTKDKSQMTTEYTPHMKSKRFPKRCPSCGLPWDRHPSIIRTCYLWSKADAAHRKTRDKLFEARGRVKQP